MKFDLPLNTESYEWLKKFLELPLDRRWTMSGLDREPCSMWSWSYEYDE